MPTNQKKLCFICAPVDLPHVEDLIKRFKPLEDSQSLVCWHLGLLAPDESMEDSLRGFLPQADGVIVWISPIYGETIPYIASLNRSSTFCRLRQ